MDDALQIMAVAAILVLAAFLLVLLAALVLGALEAFRGPRRCQHCGFPVKKEKR